MVERGLAPHVNRSASDVTFAVASRFAAMPAGILTESPARTQRSRRLLMEHAHCPGAPASVVGAFAFPPTRTSNGSPSPSPCPEGPIVLSE